MQIQFYQFCKPGKGNFIYGAQFFRKNHTFWDNFSQYQCDKEASIRKSDSSTLKKKKKKPLKLGYDYAPVYFDWNLHFLALNDKRFLKIDTGIDKHHTQYCILAFRMNLEQNNIENHWKYIATDPRSAITCCFG